MSSTAVQYAGALRHTGCTLSDLQHTADYLTDCAPLWDALCSPAVSAREKKAVLSRLPESGMQIATSIYERHTVLTAFLTALGVDAETAAEDACRIEHVLSEETFDKLKQHAKAYIDAQGK